MGIKMNKYIEMLEFDKMTEKLKEYTVTQKAREKFDEMTPIMDEAELWKRQQETTEARMLLDRDGTPPLSNTDHMDMIAEGAYKGEMLSIEELEQVSRFAVLGMRLTRYLKKSDEMGLKISEYGRGLADLEILKEEIERCIRSGQIDDYASKELREIRKKKDRILNNIRMKLDNMLKSKKECFSESFISNRNGHYTLPVKKEHKLKISGSVIDVSSSGATYFIEPSSVSKLKAELGELDIAQSNEERRILYTLSSCVGEYKAEILLNLEYIEELDYIFAKAKLSAAMQGVEPKINTGRRIRIVNGRHPLLGREYCVPLNLELGEYHRGIIITGPNTGGKTVALKTVGLFSIMAQCGLHVPCEEADLAMNTQVLCDIGDNQSILENLSTFSAHIKNVIDILELVDKESLVLMDEVGSGTDPAEGMGIAIAILEELKNSNCSFIATTHYPEVKEYAEKTEGIQNARMAFDKESLKPLYRLEIGEAGESCAFYIAKRLGMPAKMLKRAYEATYKVDSKQQDNNEKVKLRRENGLDERLFEKGLEEISENMPEKIEHKRSGQILKAAGTKKAPMEKEESKTQKRSEGFHIGDSVMVYPQKKIGIVYQPADVKGDVGVQIQKKKVLVNHKRLQIKTKAEDMYPEDYDFSIIFDTVENRKARHLMERKYVKGLEVPVNLKES
nr:hypothetical protein [Robinsoniella peoriensis]